MPGLLRFNEVARPTHDGEIDLSSDAFVRPLAQAVFKLTAWRPVADGGMHERARRAALLQQGRLKQ